VHDWLARIESEAARCGEIVRNLLSFARSSRPRAEAVDPGELARQSLRLVQHQFDLASVATELALEPGLPLVECDPQQIKQALLAILINACEAMPQGGQLTVACRRSRLDSGEAAVEIRIQDTGIGMDEETRKHIFEPFFTTKEPGVSGGGTGLGLAVVYGIVQAHGGTVSVVSAPGQGSLFSVRIPLHQGAGEGESA
jgi:two-component system NtrC family sensor kinase